MPSRYERQGEIDAALGRTSCPFGIPAHAALWAKGHDRIVDSGEGKHPRFGRVCRRYVKPTEPML